MSRCTRIAAIVLLLVFTLAVPGPREAAAGEIIDDNAALAGLASGKAFFDINLSSAEKLPLYLQVIRQTWQGLKQQKVEPDFVVAFRGPAVTLVTSQAPQPTLDLVAELAGLGVRFEACSVATGLFGIDNSTIRPPIRVVGNTFISAIGYNSRGYASIPIQ